MIIIYIIITVVNWAFHFIIVIITLYFFLFWIFSVLLLYLLCKSVYLLHFVHFIQKTREKKSILHGYWKESSEAGRVHDNYMEYEYTFHSYTQTILRTIYCFFFVVFLIITNVCAFLCEKIEEKRGRQYLQFFSFLYLEYYTFKFILKIVSMIKHDHFILLFFCVHYCY